MVSVLNFPSVLNNNSAVKAHAFNGRKTNEESFIRHKTENEHLKVIYTMFLELIQINMITMIKLLLHGKGKMKNLKNSKIARTSLDINGRRQSASWQFPASLGFCPVICLSCVLGSYAFLSFKEELNA